MAGFENLQLSTEGKLVYFTTPAFATCGAVHVVDTTNGHEHFVSAGALVNILSADAGDRLLMTSRCYDKLDDGGVYWDYFILTHEGQIVKRAGPAVPPLSAGR